MPLPFFVIGPSLTVVGWMRDRQQRRRKVRLTVHRAFEVVGMNAAGQPVTGDENVYITVTNASNDRDIVVTHVWLDTTPPVHVLDTFPVRLQHSARWETVVPIAQVPPLDLEQVAWLARARLSPDDKTVKSRPRENVPDFGTVPRG